MQRIMICDDEPITIGPLVDRLKVEGFEVEATTSPQSCLAAAERRPFDLFILDMYLGENTPDHLADGLALVRALRGLESAVNVPIVGITGYKKDWEPEARELGLVNFFLKPFEVREVVPELCQLLKTRSKAQHAMEQWLCRTAGMNWSLLKLDNYRDGSAKLHSNLVRAKCTLPATSREARLALCLLKRGETDLELFKELGSRLQDELFPSQLNVAFHQHRLLAQTAQKTFRFLLRLENPEWERLPWEICHYSGGTERGNCLGADLRLTCARVSPDAGDLRDDLVLSGPLKVLVVGAQPTRFSQLDLCKELSVVERAFEEAGDRVEWRILGPRAHLGTHEHFVDEATPDKVEEHVNNFRPHILHFICHGNAEALVLGDRQLEIWSDYFLQFGVRHCGVKLLVLNSCLSAQPGGDSPGVARGALAAGVDAVIGHLFPVSNGGAIRFAELLYKDLVSGDPLDIALQRARKLVWADQLREKRAFLPVLFIRDRFLRLDLGPRR